MEQSIFSANAISNSTAQQIAILSPYLSTLNPAEFDSFQATDYTANYTAYDPTVLTTNTSTFCSAIT